MSVLTRERLVGTEVIAPQRKRAVHKNKTTRTGFTVLTKAFCASPGRHDLSVYQSRLLLFSFARARQLVSRKRKEVAEDKKQRVFDRKVRTSAMSDAQSESHKAFHDSMIEQKQAGYPERITFTASATSFLEMAGLDTGTRSLRQFPGSLVDLQKPLIKNLPAPLEVTRLKSGKYRIGVSGRWLEPPHRSVDLSGWPRSIRGVNFYIYSRTQRGKIVSLDEVCKAIGAKSRKPYEQRLIIGRAYRAANATCVRNATGNTASRAKMPLSISIQFVGDDSMRITPKYPTSD